MKLKQTINSALYDYDPSQYMPIMVDGRLDNRGEYVTYKAKQLAGLINITATRFGHCSQSAWNYIVDHIDNPDF